MDAPSRPRFEPSLRLPVGTGSRWEDGGNRRAAIPPRSQASCAGCAPGTASRRIVLKKVPLHRGRPRPASSRPATSVGGPLCRRSTHVPMSRSAASPSQSLCTYTASTDVRWRMRTRRPARLSGPGDTSKPSGRPSPWGWATYRTSATGIAVNRALPSRAGQRRLRLSLNSVASGASAGSPRSTTAMAPGILPHSRLSGSNVAGNSYLRLLTRGARVRST